MNVPVSFSAFKGPDGSLKIMFYEYVEDYGNDGGHENDDLNVENQGDVPKKEIKREITTKEFYREYRKLKRMQNSVRNNFLPAADEGKMQALEA